MRKYHQKQLLELVKTLHEAHAEIKRLVSDKEMQHVIGLLSDCQDSAAQIGGFIEQLKGEGTKTVAFLEEYCDQLYLMGAAINDSGSGAGILKQIKKLLYIIENSIKTELLPDRIEMLFIPYKASMWDAMESVWLAAKDDPQCEAVVMPIPYYDRKPGGAFGQMHYEGDQFPDSVPVADWRKYNIEERRPDIIVTSNPYDEGNYITTIHPDFYNKRLKDFTDLLVYIPYFVAVDNVDEVFCVCAGTIYADKVIVQSEKVRQTYLRMFRKFEKDNNCKDKFGKAEAKFVALGSPKFDKVINMKREDCLIPDEWLRLIEKPDGSRKKVILYNTSIYGALNENEKALNKLRYVFDCFRNRNDVILLWRPHPLNAAAYESMRPQLLEAYRNIVAEYKRQGFGIYDDSPDMNRAIAISDAYYGDGSSLAILYLCTGKPVMIQNVEISQKSDKSKRLIFENLYDDGEVFWFTARDFNGLFKMDKQTWKTEFAGSFPGERKDGKKLYGQIAASGGKLYFAPGMASGAAEYDPASCAFRVIMIDETKEKVSPIGANDIRYYEIIPYKRWLFIVGCTCPVITRLDTETGMVDTFSEWLAPLDRLTAEPNGYYFKSVCVAGSGIAVAALRANAVVIFDMESCTSEIHEVGSQKQGYTGICFDGREYWLSPESDGPVVRWSPKKTYKEYRAFPDGFVSGRPSFWNICYSDGYVWLFPKRANMALKINILDESITLAEEFQPECYKEGSSPNYTFSRAIDNMIFACTGKSSRFIAYDSKTGQRREEEILISDIDISAINRNNIFNIDSTVCITAKNCMFSESDIKSLEEYLASIVYFGTQAQIASLSARQIEICQNTIINSDGTSGKRIYGYCAQLVLKDKGGRG